MCPFAFSFPPCSIYVLLFLYCFFTEASLAVYIENDFGPGSGDDLAGIYISHYP